MAAILSATYIDCRRSMGPEISAVFDALSASEETESFRQSWRAFLIDEFRKAFAPFVKLPRREGKALLLGLLGACEAMAEAAGARRVSRGEAVSALSRIMIGALRAK